MNTMKNDLFKKVLIVVIIVCVASFGLMIAYTFDLYRNSSITSVISNEE